MAITSVQSTANIVSSENNVVSEVSTEHSGLDQIISNGPPPPTEGWIYPRGVPHTDEV